MGTHLLEHDQVLKKCIDKINELEKRIDEQNKRGPDHSLRKSPRKSRPNSRRMMLGDDIDPKHNYKSPGLGSIRESFSDGEFVAGTHRTKGPVDIIPKQRQKQ
jgi:hypothetical protein